LSPRRVERPTLRLLESRPAESRTPIAMKASETIRFSADGPVAQLELHRPERVNALGKSMLLEIQDAMDAFEADAALRVLVLHGAGRGFSSGFDLKEQMTRNPQGAQVWREILDLDFGTTMRFWD